MVVGTELNWQESVFSHKLTKFEWTIMMYFQNKHSLIVFCLIVLSYCVQIVPALDCWVTAELDVSKVDSEDCQMHTGCLKRYDKKTQQVLEKSCFLTPGVNDTCFDDPNDSNVGVCWCHTDLCNSASSWKSSSLSWVFRIIAWISFPALLIPRSGGIGRLLS